MQPLTVVMYHYVRDLKLSRFPAIRGLDIKLFERQLLFLRRHYNFVRSEEVVVALGGGAALPPKAVLLTFDDGYIDHYTNAFPILDKLGIQGSFYVPARAVLENKVLDVNKIHFILASDPELKRIIDLVRRLLDKYRKHYELESFESYWERYAVANRFDSAATMFVKKLLQFVLQNPLRSQIVDELFQETVGVDEKVFARELYMDLQQIQTMLRNGMHVGCHGFDHFWWTKLSRGEMIVELDRSLEFLASVGVSMDNWTACYPYGAYDEQAVGLLQERNCRYALTTDVSVAEVDPSRRFFLPRLDTNDFPTDEKATPNTWFEAA